MKSPIWIASREIQWCQPDATATRVSFTKLVRRATEVPHCLLARRARVGSSPRLRQARTDDLAHQCLAAAVTLEAM